MNGDERRPNSSRKIFGIPYAGAGQAVVRAADRSAELSEVLESTQVQQTASDVMRDDILVAEQIAVVTGSFRYIGKRT